MSPAPVYAPRLALLQKQLHQHQACLITDPHDITYFSGFMTLVPEEREAYLVVTKRQAYLLYSSFSPLPEPLEVSALAGTYPGQVAQHFQYITQETRITELMIDKTKLFVLEYEALTSGCELRVETLDKKWLWNLRQVKDGPEIEAIRAAAKIAIQAYTQMVPLVVTGVSELQVQLWLEAKMRDLGSYQTAFPTIVAFGPHTALPHHQPSDLKLQNNMAVLLDFGATVDGYRSDITRSFWLGAVPDPHYLKIKMTVDAAYQAVIDLYAQKTSAGKISTAADLDSAARNVITASGFSENFIHTTGHGVGLDIHEPPSLSARNTQEIQPSMVLTVEPGIYVRDQFGYRYENTVLVSDMALLPLTVL